MPLILGFHTKYILNPWSMNFNPTNVLLMAFAIFLKSSMRTVVVLPQKHNFWSCIWVSRKEDMDIITNVAEQSIIARLKTTTLMSPQKDAKIWGKMFIYLGLPPCRHNNSNVPNNKPAQCCLIWALLCLCRLLLLISWLKQYIKRKHCLKITFYEKEWF